jgi:hypothetical protein
MNNKEVLISEFRFYPSQADKYLKIPEKILTRAIKDTQIYKPNDRKYLRDKINDLTKPQKKEPMRKVSPVTVSPKVRENINKEVSEVAEKHKGAPLFDCEICGESDFHGRLKHGWKMFHLVCQERAKVDFTLEDAEFLLKRI